MEFNPEDTVLDIVNDTSLLGRFLFPHDMLNNKVSKLSGGEKRRLYLLTVLMQKPNLLVMDEPTNDLDIVTLNILEEYLKEFSGTLTIVSHDRHFLDRLVYHRLARQTFPRQACGPSVRVLRRRCHQGFHRKLQRIPRLHQRI